MDVMYLSLSVFWLGWHCRQMHLLIKVPQVCSKYTIYMLRQQLQRRSNMYVYVQQV